MLLSMHGGDVELLEVSEVSLECYQRERKNSSLR